jgi:hypothetical protein
VINNTNLPFHRPSLPKTNVLNEFSGKGMSALLVKAIFQDHLINDLAAKDAPPSKKFFTYTVELLVNHDTTTSMTLHMSLLRTCQKL